jgi:SAM-dependent methyltransferase
VIGDHVRYFDVLDREGLLKRALEIGYPVKMAPYIHYVSPVGDLRIIRDKFAAALSCHCIEHQPDLIRHLQQVAGLLNDDGLYYLIIPDKRFCFDHFIPESTIADILDAYFSERRVHRLASVIEHRALTVHNDCVRHWSGDHGDEAPNLAERTRKAVEEYQNAQGGYVDVHAWQFTPESFERSIAALHELNYSPLRPLRVHATTRNRNEFTAILCK